MCLQTGLFSESVSFWSSARLYSSSKPNIQETKDFGLCFITAQAIPQDPTPHKHIKIVRIIQSK